MKNQGLSTILVFLILATVFACNNPTKSKTDIGEATVNNARVIPRDTISLAQFNKWIATWEQNSKNYMDTSTIKYWSIPKTDLSQFVTEKHFGVRNYIGMDDNMVPHSILVGTDGNGNIKVGPDNHIYDVTAPCPSACNDL